MSDPNWPPPAPPAYQSATPSVTPAEGYAGWGRRAVAWLIDAVITVGLVYGIGGAGRDADGTAVVLLLTCVALALLYPAMTMMRPGAHNGQTFGKQALGIRVLRDGGEPMTFGWGLLRDVVCKGALNLFFIPIVISYLWPLWDDRKQTLHDKMAGTVIGRV